MDKVIYNKSKQRPKFINLLKIRMPVTAVASILHRITGLILILILPVIIYGLGLSLQGEDGFDQAILLVESPVGRFLFIFIAVSTFYHLLAGIRFLLIDLDIGQSLPPARWSALFVIIATIVIMLILVTGVTGL